MDVSFYIARRYLISKKSSNAINIISWLSVAAIAFTTAALVIILSAMNGLTGTVANLYNSFEPDIKVTLARGKYFEDSKELIAGLKSVKGVKIVSRSFYDKGFIKNVDKQSIVTVKGVDTLIKKVTLLDSAVKEGYFEPGLKNGILLGRGVANQLQLSLGEFASELSIYSPLKGKLSGVSLESQVNQEYFRPQGIFSLNDEFDFEYVFINLETAQSLFDSPGKISALEILCEPGMTGEVQEALKEKLGQKFMVKNRYELNDVLFKSLETEKLATFIILAFILIIATFNIIGALTMLIIEKKKDIGTLYSLGANRGLVRNVFMREGMLITGIGAIGGLLLGLLVCWLQIRFHLVKFGDDFIIPYYPVELRFTDFVWILCLIMLIGFMAALYPVRVFTRNDFSPGKTT